MKPSTKHDQEKRRKLASLADAADLARAEGEGMIAERECPSVTRKGWFEKVAGDVTAAARQILASLRRRGREAFARNTKGAEATDRAPNRHEHRRRDTVPEP